MTWAAVIGSPIDHSLSPLLHRAAWDSLGISSTWSYIRKDVTEASLPAFIRKLDSQCVGLSVTMPCKQAIMPLLDAIDPLAQAVGSVNTVIPAAGVLTGFNTDVHGMTAALRLTHLHTGLSIPTRALILGARASASSAMAALGTLGVTDIRVAARRFNGPGSVVTAATRLGLSIDHVMWTRTRDVDEAIQAADIVISTMPPGVTDELAARISSGQVPVSSEQILLDIVYSPINTALVHAWQLAGGAVAHGLEMLLHQAALQVQLMTGREPNISFMRSSLCGSVPDAAVFLKHPVGE